MHFLSEYGIFLAKISTVVIAILLLIAGIVAIAAKEKEKEKGALHINKLNEKYDDIKESLDQETLSKEVLKADKKAAKAEKKKKKQKKKSKKKNTETKNRLFVINFIGDIKASAVNSLREEVTAILLTAKPNDEVLLRLESPGGLVNAYGLAASQLTRLKAQNIRLTIAVDKVAASGGYMMACIADKIIAAPFSVIGSIGVIAQLPNFHKLLQKKHIDFEQHTAGQFKRTLTMFGKNTSKGREKFIEEIEDCHELFKTFINEHRPRVNLDKVATGEHWFASRAKDLDLVDELQTSDDYLLTTKNHFDLYEVQYKIKKPLTKRCSMGMQAIVEKLTRVNGAAGADYL